jgi:hypothetical protein
VSSFTLVIVDYSAPDVTWMEGANCRSAARSVPARARTGARHSGEIIAVAWSRRNGFYPNELPRQRDAAGRRADAAGAPRDRWVGEWRPSGEGDGTGALDSGYRRDRAVGRRRPQAGSDSGAGDFVRLTSPDPSGLTE